MKAGKRDYDELGPWSIDKLEILTKYLSAYATVMAAPRQQRWCTGFDYIDAFAGPSVAWSREDGTLINTSPRVALETDPPFSACWFVELDEGRYVELKRLREEYPNRAIHCIKGDANELLPRKIIPQIARDRRYRAFAFIDPWAMDFRWATIEAIGQSGNIEVLVNFPIMAILREVLWRDFSKVPQASRDKMTRLWGSEGWVDDWYRREETLFGETELVRQSRDALAFGRLFEKRLRTAFAYTAEPLPMQNSQNAPLYTLQFAGPNATGSKIMDDIMGDYKE